MWGEAGVDAVLFAMPRAGVDVLNSLAHQDAGFLEQLREPLP